MTRPCKCGLGLRPRRLFGFAAEPMDGAPCFFSGSLTPGGCGLPSTGRLADCFVCNGKIQEGSKVAGDQPHKVVADPKLSPEKKEKILDCSASAPVRQELA